MDEDVPAALDRLVARGVLDRVQAQAVLAELAGPTQPARPGGRRLLGEIAGYLGASFVVGATLLFLGERWDELGRGGRVGMLAGMTVILAACGAAVRLYGPTDDVRRRLASTLLTGSALAAAFTVYAGFAPIPYAETTVEWVWFAAAATGLVVVLGGYLLARSALGQLGTAAAAFAVYAALLDLRDAMHQVPLGLGTVALGVGWAVLAARRLVAEGRAAVAIAVVFGLLGAQLVTIDGSDPDNYVGYLLTAMVAGACFAAYTRVREWILLAGGVVGATLVAPEFLYDVTDGSLGASGVMLVAGVTLLAGSIAGLRIRRPPPDPTEQASASP